jgi:hypothetical protein
MTMPFLPRIRPVGDVGDIDPGGSVAAAEGGTSVVRPAAPSTVFVELGEAAQKAQIARDGVGVPQVKVNADVLSGIIVGRPEFVTKVVSQSVRPGTAVPKGTSIDIVLVQPGFLPTNVFTDTHTGLAGQPIGTVFENFLQNNPDLRNIVARNDSPDTLTDADKGAIQAAFAAQNVPLSDTPGQTMEQGFTTLQAAFAFGAA